MDLERRLGAVEDQGQPPGRTGGRAEQGDRLGGDPRGVAGEVHGLDRLVAGADLVAPEAVGEAAGLDLVGAGGGGVETPPDSTMTCSTSEPSLLAKKRCSRTNSRDASWVVTPSTEAMASSARISRSIFSSRLTSKGSRSTGVRYRPTATGRGRGAPAGGAAAPTPARSGTRPGRLAQAVHRGGRRRRIPSPVDDDPDAHPLVLEGGDLREAAVLDGERLDTPLDDPAVRIAGPAGDGDVEGQLGDVLHRRPVAAAAAELLTQPRL